MHTTVMNLKKRIWTQLAHASAYPSSIIKRVLVVGGTHGNEYTGVWCIKAIQHQQRRHEKDPFLKTFPSLNISTLLGNPKAYLENKRFIDSDLNREFLKEKLLRNSPPFEHYQSESNYKDLNEEEQRALEIDTIFGSKIEGQGKEKTDVVVDLHSTTTNMGMTLIINEGDALMAQAAAYILAKFAEDNKKNDGNVDLKSCRCIMHSLPDKDLRSNLSSIGKHGFTIEVGPVPQGILRHDAIENTQRALHLLLEFLHGHNENKVQMINELKAFYPDGTVPVFLSAPAKKPGELSGKITWPCDDENPNFPSVFVHKDIQDNDFHLIRTGDPLFVQLDGSTIDYNGSHGDEVYLMFVNEGGYYYKSSGTGISVAVASEFKLNDGFINNDDVQKRENR